MTHIRCGKCGESIEVDDTLPRLSVWCARCGNTFKVSFDEERLSPQRFSRIEELHLCEDDEENQ